MIPLPRLLRRTTGLALAAAASSVAAGELAAQPAGDATVRGTAELAESGRPVTALEVQLERVGTAATDTATTDSAGAFAFRDRSAGEYRLWTVHLGERRRAGTVDVGPGEVAEVRLTVRRPVYEVETLEVTVRAPRWKRRLEGFERRRRRGHGYFLGPAEIRRLRARQSTDVLRAVPGLRIGADGGAQVSVRTGRTAGECRPTIWINGQPLMGYDVNNIPIDELLAVEVFRGRSEIPARFLLPGDEQCAAIVAWTRTGPGPSADRPE